MHLGDNSSKAKFWRFWSKCKKFVKVKDGVFIHEWWARYNSWSITVKLGTRSDKIEQLSTGLTTGGDRSWSCVCETCSKKGAKTSCFCWIVSPFSLFSWCLIASLCFIYLFICLRICFVFICLFLGCRWLAVRIYDNCKTTMQ